MSTNAPARPIGDTSRTKACPACGQLNALSRLSCILCAAKFSVKHTAKLLRERNPVALVRPLTLSLPCTLLRTLH